MSNNKLTTLAPNDAREIQPLSDSPEPLETTEMPLFLVPSDAWESYLLNDPYDAPDIDRMPAFIKGEGFGNYVARTKKFGMNMVKLGKRASETNGTPEEVQLIRLDWDTDITPEGLATIIRDEKAKDEIINTDSLPGQVVITKGDFMISEASRPGTENVPGRNIISVLGTPEELATNPLVRLIGELTISQDPENQDYLKFMKARFEEIEGIASAPAIHEITMAKESASEQALQRAA